MLKEVLDTNVDFDKLFEVKSLEEVSALLDKHLLGDDGDTAQDAPASTEKKASSVDEAFQDLLAS